MFLEHPGIQNHHFIYFSSKNGVVFLRVGQPYIEQFSLFKAELEVSLSPPFSVSPTSPLESSASKRARPSDLTLSGGGAKFASENVKHTGGESLTDVLMQRTEMLLGNRRAGKRTAPPADSGNPLELTEWPAVGGNPLEKWTASLVEIDMPLARTEGTAVVEQTGTGKCEYSFGRKRFTIIITYILQTEEIKLILVDITRAKNVLYQIVRKH
jgi:hypothetical protein